MAIDEPRSVRVGRVSVAGGRARTLSRSAGFWLVGAVLVLLLFSSSVPSPLYVVYQQEWHFSAAVLTVVFAVYAVAVLASLLVFGSLSDVIGRRRVLLAALVLAVAAMVVFATAGGVGALLVARGLQGFAVGLATGAMGAALIELAPPAKPARGTLVNSAAPTLGMAAGALVAGLLVQYAPAPAVLTYLLLAVAFALALVAVVFLPETAPGAGRGLRVRPHRISVPGPARRPFALLSLALVAVWAVGGFYLSLGPSLVLQLLHSRSHLVGGLSVAVLAGIATVGQLALGRLAALRIARLGLLLLVAGLVLVLVALWSGGAVVFFAGTAVLGMGWGATFLGAFRSLAALAAARSRGELMAAVYVVAYVSMSVPAVLAGLVSSHLGLHRTAVAFVVAVGAVCLIALAGLNWAAPDRARPGTADAPAR
ncbi:MFS family permease [Streptacidiphilus sp. MAP12-16]|uniref:MFS transporter n=1 Tax=Streptacidiphilus sp. MAP12-16 TaxID=3156300 RepID=UPI003515AA0C